MLVHDLKGQYYYHNTNYLLMIEVTGFQPHVRFYLGIFRFTSYLLSKICRFVGVDI